MPTSLGSTFRSSRFLTWMSAAVFAVVPLAMSAHATTVTFIESGTSIDGHPLSVRAVLTGTGNTLTIDFTTKAPRRSAKPTC